MKEKMDRRKIRTKQLLRQALLELIGEKGMDGVTVSDLTERAGVNRGTFYLHYRDVADLLEQLKAEIFEGLSKEIEQLNPLELESYARKGEPYPPSVRLLDYFAKHADFFQVMFGPKGDISLPLQIKELFKTRLFELIFRHIPQMPASRVPRDYVIAFITSANLGVLMHWFETGRELPSREVAMIVTRIVSDGPLATFGLKS